MMRLTQVLGSDSFERSVSPRMVELVPDDDHAVAVLTAPDGSLDSGRPGLRLHMTPSAIARILSFTATVP